MVCGFCQGIIRRNVLDSKLLALKTSASTLAYEFELVPMYFILECFFLHWYQSSMLMTSACFPSDVQKKGELLTALQGGSCC